jgi:hypothetical protein
MAAYTHAPRIRILDPSIRAAADSISLDLAAVVTGWFNPVTHNPMDVYVVCRLCVSQA